MLMFNGLAAQHNPSIVALVSQLPRTQHQRCQTAAIKISADNNETILAITRDASLVLTQKKVGWQTHRQCELIPAAKYATCRSLAIGVRADDAHTRPRPAAATGM